MKNFFLTGFGFNEKINTQQRDTHTSCSSSYHTSWVMIYTMSSFEAI